MPAKNGAVRYLTMADVLERVGNVPPSRVRLRPPPGEATEADVIRIHDRENKLYELVEGVLVEKVTGYPESSLMIRLAGFLEAYLARNDLGNLAGADGTMRLMPGLVYIPDLSFVCWDRLPGRKVPEEPIPDLAPDLAVEILSPGNTKKEMRRKLKDYFLAGTRLVWFIDPRARTAQVFTAPDQPATLTEADTLTGGEVLPGFSLRLADLFARLPAPRKASSRRKRKS